MPDTDSSIRWVATLSNGETAVEHSGDYQIIPGERKPWVRLTKFLVENDLYLTSLRLNFKGRTVHLPRPNFDRFGLNQLSKEPLFYSLQYNLEGEIKNGGILEQKHFIDLVSHYDTYEVHFIQDLEGHTSWVVVTEGYRSLAPTPPIKHV
jgi:hypothetical protein